MQITNSQKRTIATYRALLDERAMLNSIRNALSIYFTQSRNATVSYTQPLVSYEHVINEVNVLDMEIASMQTSKPWLKEIFP